MQLTKQRIDELKKLEIKDASKLFNELKEKIAKLKEEKSYWQAEFDFIRLNLIPDRMDDEGISNIKFEGIGKVILTSDIYVKIIEKEEAFKWLKANKHGDMIQPNVASSTLKAFIKDAMKKGEKLPEKIFKITPFTRASIRKK